MWFRITAMASLCALMALSGCITIVVDENDDHSESRETSQAAPRGGDDETPEPGPNLGLTTASAATNADHWSIRITSATQAQPLHDYSFVLSSPGAGDVAVPWDDANEFARFETNSGNCFQLTLSTSGGELAVGDRLALSFEEPCGESGSFPSGSYTLEIVHRPTASSAGSLSRNF